MLYEMACESCQAVKHQEGDANITLRETRPEASSSTAAVLSTHRAKRTHRCPNKGGSGFTCADRAVKEEAPYMSEVYSMGDTDSFYGPCRRWNYNQAKCDNSYVQNPDTDRVYFCKYSAGGGGCAHAGMCDVYVDQAVLACSFPGPSSTTTTKTTKTTTTTTTTTTATIATTTTTTIATTTATTATTVTTTPTISTSTTTLFLTRTSSTANRTSSSTTSAPQGTGVGLGNATLDASRNPVSNEEEGEEEDVIDDDDDDDADDQASSSNPGRGSAAPIAVGVTVPVLAIIAVVGVMVRMRKKEQRRQRLLMHPGTAGNARAAQRVQYNGAFGADGDGADNPRRDPGIVPSQVEHQPYSGNPPPNHDDAPPTLTLSSTGSTAEARGPGGAVSEESYEPMEQELWRQAREYGPISEWGGGGGRVHGSADEPDVAVVERGDVVYNSNDAGDEPATSSMQQQPAAVYSVPHANRNVDGNDGYEQPTSNYVGAVSSGGGTNLPSHANYSGYDVVATDNASGIVYATYASSSSTAPQENAALAATTESNAVTYAVPLDINDVGSAGNSSGQYYDADPPPDSSL